MKKKKVEAAGSTDGAAKRKAKTYAEKSESAKAHSDVAETKSDDANDDGDADDHYAAASAHQVAADKHRAAAKMATDTKVSDDHEAKAREHEKTAMEHLRKSKTATASQPGNATVKAADGEVTGKPSFGTLRDRVQTAIQGDARFDDGLRGYVPSSPCTPCASYHDAPWCVDILVPDDDGELCAVIRTSFGKTVKHYFTWNGEKVTMDEGDSEPTESTQVYSKAIEEHDKIRAVEFSSVVQCHEVGIAIKAKKTWTVGEQTSFQWMPGGTHIITASYGRGKNNRPIRMAVQADKDAAEKVQASFDSIKSENPRRPPYGCIEHRAEERAFDPIKFEWRDDPEPAIYCVAEPSELGARNVNGKIHTSFSPTFDTDADYHLLKCSECGKKTGKCECSEAHLWVFPDGARGAEDNPASVTRIDAQSVGSLTNWPAFKEILPIAARQPTVAIEETNPTIKTMSERRTNSQTLLDGLVKQAEDNRNKSVEAVASRQTKTTEALNRIKVVPETAQQKVERLWARTRSTGHPLQN